MSEREGTAFIGFTYNGKHSIDDFGVYRTSDGKRYNYNLIPQLNDKTVDVPGGHGQHYFNSRYKTRQFSIPIAFDNLSEELFHKMKQWFNGTEIHELSFDERTEVKYSAKVTGTPQLKIICFEEEYTVSTGSGEDIVIETKKRNVYKGEGTIQFTCYFPFGYAEEDEYPSWNNTTTQDKVINTNISIGGELPTTFEFSTTGIVGEVEIGNLKIKVTNNESFTWDSKTGLVISNSTDKPIPYTGKSYGTVGPGQVSVKFTLKSEKTASVYWKNLYY